MVYISQAMSAHPLHIIQCLTLISAANGAPVLVAWALRARPARPIDGGIVLRDGHPLLGRSKTWRGIASAIVLATFVALLIGLPWRLGVLAATSAMAGDGLSSFFKRRFGLEPSSMTLGLDQIAESLRIDVLHRRAGGVTALFCHRRELRMKVESKVTVIDGAAGSGRTAA